jgi:hypothetical protein
MLPFFLLWRHVMHNGYDISSGFVRNFFKISFLVIISITSTLGLRTELTVILNDVFIATWAAIGWVFIMIGAGAYYTAAHEIDVKVLKEYRENIRMIRGDAK